MLVQETLLKPSVRSPRIANFNMVRNDRPTAKGGGTAIYYRRSLHCVPLDPPPLTNIEASVCRIAMAGHAPITLVSAYLSPKKELLKSDLEALFGLDSSVIVAGDLNCKHTLWCCQASNPNGIRLDCLVDELDFDVVAPMTPTHYPYTVRHRPDILDIALLRNVTLQLHSIEVLHELESDHRPVLLHLGVPTEGTHYTKMVTDWRKLSVALETVGTSLAESPTPLKTKDETDAAIDALTGCLSTAILAASRQVSAANDRRWRLPEDIRGLLREKNAATRHYDAFPSEENRVRLRSLQREVKKRISELRNQHWDHLLGEIEPSHQAYWKLARSLKSDTVVQMPPLIRPDKTVAFDDIEKAECLADSVQAQCSNDEVIDNDHLETVDSEIRHRSSLPLADQLASVTIKEVQTIIRNLKDRKAPGADGISNRALKQLPVSLVTLLVAIFNAAMTHCHFPSVWKHAIVIGIHKPGKDSSNPSSYRPISLLSSLGKVYEKLLLRRLQSFALSNKLIPDEQFGFRPRHSCVQQVHRLTEHILDGMHRKPKPLKTGAIFLDVAKAFDKVWHNGLIYKLYSFKVPDRLVLIVRDFLSDRKFSFRVDGTLSSPHTITAGVPQGSALSPLLYTLYTSDFPRCPRVEMALFADDTALYTSDVNRRYITLRLQKAASLLDKWFRKWRIQVNPEKSAAMLFSRGGLPPTLRTRSRIKMSGQEIPWVTRVKYLGVTFDDRMSFRHHIKTVRDRAAFFLGRLNPLICGKSKMSLKNKLTLYKACIRPVMTYASVAFAHVADVNIESLQKLQNRFIRKAVGAPWYVRNIDLHCDMELPSIRSYMRRTSERFFNNAPHHPNPLVVAAAIYTPDPDPGNTVHFRMRRRRPRHVLTDPDDNIATALGAVVQKTRSTTTHRVYTYRHRPRRRGRRNPLPKSVSPQIGKHVNPAEFLAGSSQSGASSEPVVND